VSFKSLEWVPNVESTRWFLVLRLEQPANDGLNRMLRVANGVLSSFGQPPLYAVGQSEARTSLSENRRKRGFQGNRTVRTEDRGRTDVMSKSTRADVPSQFHISIGWSLEKPSTDELERVRGADISDLLIKTIRFDAVKVKIGNAITVIPLARRVEVGKGLIGGLMG